MSDLLWTAVNYALLGLATVAILGWGVSQLGGGKKRGKVAGGRLVKTGSRSLVLRAIRTAVWLVKAAVLGWMGDLPGSVNPEPGLESLKERREQMVAAVAWPTVAVLLILGGLVLPALAVGTWSIVIVARRVMASRGHSWSARRMFADARFWAKHRLWIGGPFAVTGVAMPLWLGLLYDGEAPLAWTIPYGTWVGCAALVASSEAGWRTRVTRLHRALAQAHGVTPKVIAEEAVLRPGNGREMRMVLVPPAVIAHLDRADAGVAEQMPEYEVEVRRADGSNAVTAISYRPTTAETMEARDLLAATNGMLLSLTPVGEPLPWRPDEHLGRVDPSVGGTKGGELDALLRERGFHVVDWRPEAHEVSVARLGPKTASLRDAITRELGLKEPWDIEIGVVADATGPRTVYVARSPGMRGPEGRQDAWARVAASLLPVGAGERWLVVDEPSEKRVTLVREFDPLVEVLPYDDSTLDLVTADTPWRVGRDEAGRWIDVNLAAGAHMLIAGATRSGKSVCTYSLLTHVLRMGTAARLLVADPNDTTIAPFEKHVAASTTSTHPDAVTEMLEWVRGEMDRRKPILRRMQQDKINPEQFNEGLPLIVVVIDEAANYLRHAEKNAAAAMRGELLAVVSQGAKYGIRLVLITQRPDSTILDTSTRAQLSMRISFRVEDKETAAMVFPDLDDPTALLRCPPGVGYMREVGEEARRFRSLYLADHWGVAKRLPALQPRIDLGNLAAPEPTPEPVVPEVRHLGTVEVSLDDLDLDDAELRPATDFDDEPAVGPLPVSAPTRNSIWE